MSKAQFLFAPGHASHRTFTDEKPDRQNSSASFSTPRGQAASTRATFSKANLPSPAPEWHRVVGGQSCGGGGGWPGPASIIHPARDAHAPRHLLSAAARPDLGIYFFCPDAGLAGSWTASSALKGCSWRDGGPTGRPFSLHTSLINLAPSRLRRTPAHRPSPI